MTLALWLMACDSSGSSGSSSVTPEWVEELEEEVAESGTCPDVTRAGPWDEADVVADDAAFVRLLRYQDERGGEIVGGNTAIAVADDDTVACGFSGEHVSGPTDARWSAYLQSDSVQAELPWFGEPSVTFATWEGETAVGGTTAWACLASAEPVEGTIEGPGRAEGTWFLAVDGAVTLFGTFTEADCAVVEDAGIAGDGASCWYLGDCDGVDNDFDGVVDEGAQDSDGDGVADCVQGIEAVCG